MDIKNLHQLTEHEFGNQLKALRKSGVGLSTLTALKQERREQLAICGCCSNTGILLGKTCPACYGNRTHREMMYRVRMPKRRRNQNAATS